jgi:hypothetical protein
MWQPLPVVWTFVRLQQVSSASWIIGQAVLLWRKFEVTQALLKVIFDRLSTSTHSYAMMEFEMGALDSSFEILAYLFPTASGVLD